MDYINENCPACRKQFTEDDDIVVCPECGTPQHRECWLAAGKCVNDELHSKNYTWQPAFNGSVQPPEQFEEEKTDGTVQPESEPSVKPFLARDLNDEAIEAICMRGVIANKDQTFDGIRVGDAALYIQQSARNYINKFLKGKKISFNWGALIFAPAWFFYRKMYKVGAVFLTIIVALSLFTMPIQAKIEAQANELMPIIEEKKGASPAELASLFEDEAFFAKYKSFVKNETTVILITAVIPNIAAAFLGNYLYKKKIKKDLELIEESANQDTQFKKMLIMQKGGISFLAGALVLAVQTSIAPMLLEAGNYIMNLFR